MKKLLFALILAVSMILGAVDTAWSEKDPVEMFSFADSLYEEGDYYRAITEYKRFIFSFPRHQFFSKAEFYIAMCYFKGGKWDLASQMYRSLATRYAQKPIGKNALFHLAKVYYRSGQYGSAIRTCHELQKNYLHDPLAGDAKIMLSICYLRLRQSEKAKEVLDGSLHDAELSVTADGLAQEIEKYKSLPSKSPELAAGLSAVIPGSGQLYVKRPRDAAISFLLNSLFIGAALGAFNNDENVLGGTLLFVESIWYFGNIYNATNSAHKYNSRIWEKFMKNVELIYAPFIHQDVNGGIGLGIGIKTHY